MELVYLENYVNGQSSIGHKIRLVSVDEKHPLDLFCVFYDGHTYTRTELEDAHAIFINQEELLEICKYYFADIPTGN